MRLRRFSLPSTVLCALAFAAAPPAHAVPEDFFGVNGQMLPLLSPQQQQRHLAAMAAGGLQFVRHDASWVHAEPEPPDPVTGAHAYRWDELDRQVALYAANGLRRRPIQGSTPRTLRLSRGATAGPVTSGASTRSFLGFR